MKKKTFLLLLAACITLTMTAQTAPLKKVYNEDINPITQINQAIEKGKSEGKFVICQVGGNWCPWCLKFADFITKDTTISKVIENNYEYIHVNYNPRRSTSGSSNTTGQSQETKNLEQGELLMQRLNNAGRFGFPVFVILDMDGKVIHIQDSSFLEEGEGYNQEKVLRFLKNWTPQAIKQ